MIQKAQNISKSPKAIALSVSLFASAIMANLNAQTTLKQGANLHIQPGASLHTSGIHIDTGSISGKGEIINYGDLIANTQVMDDTDSLSVRFAGSTQQTIGGSVGTKFFDVEINNPAGAKLGDTLQSSIKIGRNATMTQGVLDLNGKDIDLGHTGQVQESNTSYIFDNVNNGSIKAAAALDNPVGVNPGNLGIEITGGGNMDTVQVVRRHMDEMFAAGAFLTYTVNPKNQPTSNVAVTIHYAPHHTQVGMGDPASYDVYRNDAGNWLPTSGTSDVPNSSVSTILPDGFKDGLTIGNMGAPLSVTVLNFSVHCQDGFPLLSWKTASETDSNFFEVQRSLDGIVRESIGQVPAAGYSNDIREYTFSDTSAVSDGKTYYYRFSEHDLDGNVTPYQIVASHCVLPGIDNMTLFPNPTSGPITIQLQSQLYRDMKMSVVDLNGKLVDQRDIHTIYGIIQHYADFSHLANGMYIMQVGDQRLRFIITK